MFALRWHSRMLEFASRAPLHGITCTALHPAPALSRRCSLGWWSHTAAGRRYAVNDAIIMWLFAVVALELKHRAPKAHTMLVCCMPHIPWPACLSPLQPHVPNRKLRQCISQLSCPRRVSHWRLHPEYMLAEHALEQDDKFLIRAMT